jgi:hypothetical protein
MQNDQLQEAEQLIRKSMEAVQTISPDHHMLTEIYNNYSIILDKKNQKLEELIK